MTPKEFEDEIRARGDYLDVRTLEDGTVIGLGELAFTRAIYFDMDLAGWGRRFCYEDRQLAVIEYAKIVNGNTEPQGFIAQRPEK